MLVALLRLLAVVAAAVLGVWLVRTVIAIIDDLRFAGHLPIPEIEAVRTEQPAPWDQPDARPLDDIRSALDLFERNYREQVHRPAVWIEPGGDVRFDPAYRPQHLDPDRWRRDRRRHGPTPL